MKKIALLTTVLLLVFTLVPRSAYAADLEKEALIALFNSANGGSSWNDTTNWLIETDHCTWYGVTCDGNGNVTFLDLANNKLAGLIPPQLGNLSHLLWLALDGNQLFGPIPETIAFLSSLYFLSLGNNPDSACWETAAALAWAQGLAYDGPVSYCVSVKDALISLYNYTNDYSNGGSWTNKTNWLTNTDHCNWYGVVCDIDGYVTQLNLSGNNLKGTFPRDHLLGLHPYVSRFHRLEILQLDNNQLYGSIPTELGALITLEELRLDRNQLSGPIPSQLGSLKNLMTLLLDNNNLSGPIPPQLGLMSSLKQFVLSYNQLSGPIPSELGSLSILTTLNLQFNNLSGIVPAKLANLSNLQQLYLDGNPDLKCWQTQAAFAWAQGVSQPLWPLTVCPSTYLPLVTR